MMTLNNLYALAERHNHEVHHLKLHELSSFSVEDQGKCHIALSTSITGNEEKTNLAHELGHCEYGGFYNYHSPYSIRSKAEKKASRWAYMHVTPLTDISEAISKGIQSVWELAEYFDVTEQFMFDALNFYTDQIGATIYREV